MPYRIEFAASVKEQLKELSNHERALVFDEMDKQLIHEPLKETRNRKPLRPNPLAPWELRIGDLRVFYDVSSGPLIVQVLAVGRKRGNRLFIAGKEVKI